MLGDERDETGIDYGLKGLIQQFQRVDQLLGEYMNDHDIRKVVESRMIISNAITIFREHERLEAGQIPPTPLYDVSPPPQRPQPRSSDPAPQSPPGQSSHRAFGSFPTPEWFTHAEGYTPDQYTQTRHDENKERLPPVVVATNESASDWDDTISSESEEDSDYSVEDFSRSDLEFLEDEYDYFSMDMEEDDVDPDELSYEELIALGESVGVESRGLSEVEISEHLHPLTCQSTNDLLIDRCVICQVEHEEGEKLVTLRCDHPYHSDCISKWLQIKKICPVCNNEVLSKEISSNL